jgi:CheY-like chemotaxis protein
MAESSTNNTRRKNILVVDDEPGMRALFSFMLGAKGYEVRTAGSGEEALQNVKLAPYDLVFLDVRMPYMNGVEVLRALKQLRPSTPVVMMTGYAVEQLLNDAISAGARSYLRKPFTIEELMNSINGVLAAGSQAAT